MQRCPAPGCHRAGDDIQTTCPNAISGVMPCPAPVEMKGGKDILVTCKTCDKTWGLPVSDVLKGRKLPGCPGALETCKAVSVQVPK